MDTDGDCIVKAYDLSDKSTPIESSTPVHDVQCSEADGVTTLKYSVSTSFGAGLTVRSNAMIYGIGSGKNLLGWHDISQLNES